MLIKFMLIKFMLINALSCAGISPSELRTAAASGYGLPLRTSAAELADLTHERMLMS